MSKFCYATLFIWTCLVLEPAWAQSNNASLWQAEKNSELVSVSFIFEADTDRSENPIQGAVFLTKQSSDLEFAKQVATPIHLRVVAPFGVDVKDGVTLFATDSKSGLELNLGNVKFQTCVKGLGCISDREIRNEDLIFLSQSAELEIAFRETGSESVDLLTLPTSGLKSALEDNFFIPEDPIRSSQVAELTRSDGSTSSDEMPIIGYNGHYLFRFNALSSSSECLNIKNLAYNITYKVHPTKDMGQFYVSYLNALLHTIKELKSRDDAASLKRPLTQSNVIRILDQKLYHAKVKLMNTLVDQYSGREFKLPFDKKLLKKCNVNYASTIAMDTSNLGKENGKSVKGVQGPGYQSAGLVNANGKMFMKISLNSQEKAANQNKQIDYFGIFMEKSINEFFNRKLTADYGVEFIW